MKTHALAVAAMLLAGCAAQESIQSSGDGDASGSVASGGGDRMLNRDVSEAVSRGSTQGFSPYSPLSPGR